MQLGRPKRLSLVALAAFVSSAVVFLAPGALEAQAPAVLLSDDFEDPARRTLTPLSAPDLGDDGVVDGEYAIRVVATNQYFYAGTTAGDLADTTLAVDARVVGEVSDRVITIGCRASGTGSAINGYFLFVRPASGLVLLVRRDAGQMTRIAQDRVVPALLPGDGRNRLELTCSGTAIRAAVNGDAVAEGTDDRYARGVQVLGAMAGPTVRTAEVRFDNLLVTEAPATAPETAQGMAPTASPEASASPEPAASPSSSPQATPSSAPTAVPTPTAAPAAIPASAATGRVLIDASLASPVPFLRTSPTDGGGASTGYRDGEYFMRQEAGPTAFGFSTFFGDTMLRDVTVGVDARIATAELANRAPVVWCRWNPPQPGQRSVSNGYRFVFELDSGVYELVRFDPTETGSRRVVLHSGLRFSYVALSGSVRIELSCVGSTITAYVNGVMIATATDETYRQGWIGLGVSVSRANIDMEVRYKNLLVREP